MKNRTNLCYFFKQIQFIICIAASALIILIAVGLNTLTKCTFVAFKLNAWLKRTMTLKNGRGKCSLFVLSAKGWKDQNMDFSFSRQKKPWYGGGIAWLVSIDF